jgi:diguanylate cyclase (GGDEF)-like protein
MNVGQLMNIRPRSRPRPPIERSATGAPAALPGAQGPPIDGGQREQSAPGEGLERPQAGAAKASSGRTRAFLVGGLIFVLGLLASGFLAGEWRSNVTNSNRKSFQSTAADVTNTLDSKLDTTLELTRTMRAIAVMEPRAGNTRFREWYAQLRLGTSPSTGAVAQLIQPVTASGLPAFRRQAEADPAFRALLKGPFQIVPSGRRPLYCLMRAIVGPATASSLYPPLLDYCDAVLPGIGPSPFAALVRTATDTNTNIVIPVPAFKVVAIGATVYRLGAPLATVAERRAAMTGVIGTSFDSTTLIASVLAGHQSLALALYHRSPGGPLQLIGRAGAVSKGASPSYAQVKEIGEGWLVVVKGTVPGAFSANTQGLFVLGLGLLVTVLGMLLYLVLVRSRRRAWGLVGEKTGELEYRALHDPLTDLPNRTLVLDRADQLLARARRAGHPVTVLFVDVDDFKQINDRFGHRAGDEVLRRVSARMKTVLRESDTVGRLSGDEFVMLVDTAGLDVAPELVAERILDVLRLPIELPPPASSVAVTACIGIASGMSASAEDLLADADLALYKAKAAGKDGYALFEPSMQTAARDRMHLEMDLGEALEAEQLFLVYQPMFALCDERVVGVEALLRWRHPSNGVIAPDVFIPIAEANGSIVPIGRWVLEQACARAAAWQQKGHGLNIAVNVSARQLERAEFVEEVRAALQHSGLDSSTLTLEITETVLMRKPDATVHLLTELKALGVRIAVDDFGTGYSSLAYLRQFPVDLLKIDRTFITGLALSGEAQALAHTLIRLGQALGLQTLAEGVEHRDQVRELRREGCDLVQGFLFARPLAPDAVETLLKDRAGRSAAVATTGG